MEHRWLSFRLEFAGRMALAAGIIIIANNGYKTREMGMQGGGSSGSYPNCENFQLLSDLVFCRFVSFVIPSVFAMLLCFDLSLVNSLLNPFAKREGLFIYFRSLTDAWSIETRYLVIRLQPSVCFTRIKRALAIVILIETREDLAERFQIPRLRFDVCPGTEIDSRFRSCSR